MQSDGEDDVVLDAAEDPEEVAVRERAEAEARALARQVSRVFCFVLTMKKNINKPTTFVFYRFYGGKNGKQEAELIAQRERGNMP